MKWFFVILYDVDGNQIGFSEEHGMKRAKDRAKFVLSDEFAHASETTHKDLRTHKVAIFEEGADTGMDKVCEWDAFYP